jgi:hypothetical protein
MAIVAIAMVPIGFASRMRFETGSQAGFRTAVP